MGRLGLAHQTSAPKVGSGIILSIGARLLLARSFTLALPLMSSAAWMRERTQSRDKHPIYVSNIKGARPAILLYDRNCSPLEARKITNSYQIRQLDQIHSFAPMSQAEAQAKSEPLLIEFIRSGSQSCSILRIQASPKCPLAHTL